MPKAQHAIMRFAKVKTGSIGNIEAHDERLKEKYDSNPDIDASRTHLNYHLIEPSGRYRTEANRMIADAQCRTRKDSVRIVETLVTSSPEFMEGKTSYEIRGFFQHAVDFLSEKVGKENILSAAVHMDEKTPHMHLIFVPLTADHRLSAKDILGNKKQLSLWQDDFWSYMVQFYPDLERGESASKTGRTHIPPRVYKEAVHLTEQAQEIQKLISQIGMFNAKKKSSELADLLAAFFPDLEQFQTEILKYDKELKEMKQEVAESREDRLAKNLATAKLEAECQNLKLTLDRIPPEVISMYQHRSVYNRNR